MNVAGPSLNRHARQVVWTEGTTLGGSSGAALIDAASRRIVGVLTGGDASCAAPQGADYFGRLSMACALPLPISTCSAVPFSET